MSCIGFDGKCYYNSAATDATPTWVEIDLVRDVNTAVSADKADVSDRRSKFKKSCVALIDIETTMTLTYESGNTALDYLRDTAFLGRAPVQIAVMDGPIATSGSEGYKYYSNVYSNDFNQPLSDGETVQLTFAPVNSPSTDPGIEPSWYTVP